MPIIQVGKDGIDEEFLKQVEEALEARELIKISVLKIVNMTQEKPVMQYVKSKLMQNPVQVIGNNFSIYKKSKDKPKIELPIK